MCCFPDDDGNGDDEGDDDDDACPPGQQPAHPPQTAGEGRRRCSRNESPIEVRAGTQGWQTLGKELSDQWNCSSNYQLQNIRFCT